MTRSEARQLLMQLLFQMEVQKEYGPNIKERFLSQQKKIAGQKAYIDNLLDKLLNNLTKIDEELSSCANGWTAERMNKVDLAILRIAAAEILLDPEVPDAVAVNEAVDLAKKFGTEDSGKFINGLLGQMIKNKNAQ